MATTYQAQPLGLWDLWGKTRRLHGEGVSYETAHRWEMLDRAGNDQSTGLLQSLLTLPIYENLIQYFILYRTKSWATLRMEYWAGLKTKARAFDDDEDDDEDTHEMQCAMKSFRRERIGRQFYGFMDLPREIRDMIYEHLLVRGELYVPNDSGRLEHYEDEAGSLYRRYGNLDLESLRSKPPQHSSNRASLGLIMGVSHTVHAESTKLFFGRNRIVFPAGSFTVPFHFNLRMASILTRDLDKEIQGFINYAPLARDVSYTFDMRDHTISDHANLVWNYSLREGIDNGSLEPRQALQELHDQKTFHLEIDWAERIDSIKAMKLDRLQLSFEECYCAVGCCRKVDWVLDRFLHHGPLPGMAEIDHVWSSRDWTYRPPSIIEVIGWVSEKEKAMIRGKMSRFSQEQSVEIRLIWPRPD